MDIVAINFKKISAYSQSNRNLQAPIFETKTSGALSKCQSFPPFGITRILLLNTHLF